MCYVSEDLHVCGELSLFSEAYLKGKEKISRGSFVQFVSEQRMWFCIPQLHQLPEGGTSHHCNQLRLCRCLPTTMSRQ